MVTTTNVSKILKHSLRLGKDFPFLNKSISTNSLVELAFFEYKLGIKNKACKNPQKINVQFAPCQNPLTIKITNVFRSVINLPSLEPPNGMYK